MLPSWFQVMDLLSIPDIAKDLREKMSPTKREKVPQRLTKKVIGNLFH